MNRHHEGNGADFLAAEFAPVTLAEEPAPIAPPPAKAARAPNVTAWLASCRAANPFRPLQRLIAGKTPPLLWGLASTTDTAIVDVIVQLDRAARDQKWTKATRLGFAEFLDSLPPSIVTLAIAYSAPLLAANDRDGMWESCFARLWSSLPAENASNRLAPLEQLHLQVELPLALACFAPDAKTASALRKGAFAAEAQLTTNSLDSQGLPAIESKATLRAWLASLVRAHELVRDVEQQFPDAARERLARLTRNVLRLARPDGGSTLGTAAGSISDRELITAAVLASESAAPLAALALGTPAKAKTKAPPANVKLPKGTPASPLYSAASSFAILRTGWSAPATQVTVDFSGSQVWLDLTAGNRSLFNGNWDVQLQVDGRDAPPLGKWSEVCWHSDADCDYLEIEQKLSGGWLLQRHMLLVRRDQALLLADSVLNDTKQTPTEFMGSNAPLPQLAYAGGLPLAPDVAFAAQAESREGQLLHRQNRCGHVLPIALPEWRKQPSAGALAQEEQRLVHSLRANGRNLFAPLWLDLHPGRQKSPLTWRQLTIGESLVVLPREVAVGYRVQVHSTQWLLYRSLAWRGNRTVLGKNFATDFACCRFLPNGETEEILEVQ